jgi:phage terminase large subunit GpA-like protein
VRARLCADTDAVFVQACWKLAALAGARKILAAWNVGSNTARAPLYPELKVEARGLHYCHFPDSYQQEYFNQLISEQVRTRFVRGHPVRYWFKPSGVRNEALDRRVYAMAALHARPVPWEVLLRAAPSEPPPQPTLPPPDGGPSAPPLPPVDGSLPAAASPLPAPASRFERRRVRFRMR